METFNNNCGNSNTEWPDFYPDDLSLPPSDADDANGVFFRLVNSEPPKPTCFLSTHEEQPNRHIKYRKKGDTFNLENVYGTSFFDCKDGAEIVRYKFPDALGEKIIARGNLEPSFGKMRQHPNGSSHFTVWLRHMISLHQSFTVIENAQP